ncbi:MAG: hypothetical protein D6732_19240 [Methanobacteriota archaeon]|nr:MAG: hypothetical protein D6732_19240 [Euryarchaeota archaeon]
MIDFIFSIIFAVRLFRPAREDGFSPTSFRGSFFWSFVFFSLFFMFMSLNLVSEDALFIGLWGYTFGHIFLYIVYSVNVFAPFSVITDDKRVPTIISVILLILGGVVTYINWVAYASGETLPTFSNGVTIWNPPIIVAAYVAGASIFVWVILSFSVFMYHAWKTEYDWLRRRSRLIGLGFLTVTVGGPLHDLPLEGFYILIADIVTSLGFVIMAMGIFTSPPREG